MGLGSRGPGPQGSSGLWREAPVGGGGRKVRFESLAGQDCFQMTFSPSKWAPAADNRARGACSLCAHFSHSWGQDKIDRGLEGTGSRGIPLSWTLQPVRPRTGLHLQSGGPLPFPSPGCSAPKARRWEPAGPGEPRSREWVSCRGAGSRVLAGPA